ncbi:MAG: metallophosphatase family protein [Pseudomonadota bacterium]|nr:metallophosphatase family protein [Pseudomonadota bacterium]
MRVGLISDTHAQMRPEALAALRGSEHIVHAGDIGSPQVLDALREIAPLTVVRGNNDVDPWADGLTDTAVLQVGEVSIYVLHDVKTLTIDPVIAGHQIVVAGHSHRPGVVKRNEVLYVNPGSAGPRRFSLPITIAHLDINGGVLNVSIVPLTIATMQRR